MFSQLKYKLCLILLCLSVGACSSLPKKVLKPTVELARVIPLNVSLSNQKLRFELTVSNPNDFELPVESVNFIARFNDTDIASGKSQQATVIPASGQGLLVLDVTAGIDRLASTLQSLLGGEQLNLTYVLSGSVQIENWASAVPFNVTGVLDAENQRES